MKVCRECYYIIFRGLPRKGVYSNPLNLFPRFHYYHVRHSLVIFSQPLKIKFSAQIIFHANINQNSFGPNAVYAHYHDLFECYVF